MFSHDMAYFVFQVCTGTRYNTDVEICWGHTGGQTLQENTDSALRRCVSADMSHFMRLWYLPHRRPAKAQASLRIHAVLPEPLLFAHMKYGSRRKVQPNIKHLAPLDNCACVFEE